MYNYKEFKKKLGIKKKSSTIFTGLELDTSSFSIAAQNMRKNFKIYTSIPIRMNDHSQMSDLFLKYRVYYLLTKFIYVRLDNFRIY